MVQKNLFVGFILFSLLVIYAAGCSEDSKSTPNDADGDAMTESDIEQPASCNKTNFPQLGERCEYSYDCYGTLVCNDEGTGLICKPDDSCAAHTDADEDESEPDTIQEIDDQTIDQDEEDEDIDLFDPEPDNIEEDVPSEKPIDCQRLKSVLFDNAHAQTASNADWTISGGFSDFADALSAKGFEVDEWGDDERSSRNENDPPISYSVLKNYGVYIIPEPNTPFTSQEQADIARFVQDGGGLFLIADHIGADRNNDGWDAVEIFNGYQHESDYTITPHEDWEEFVPKYFGFTFYEVNYSQHPITDIVHPHRITEGVYSVGMWSGSTIHIDDTARVSPLIYLSNRSKGPFVVTSSYGLGKVVAIGDSSPADDGTGAPGDNLYDGWNWGDDAKLFVNSVMWLCEQ